MLNLPVTGAKKKPLNGDAFGCCPKCTFSCYILGEGSHAVYHFKAAELHLQILSILFEQQFKTPKNLVLIEVKRGKTANLYTGEAGTDKSLLEKLPKD